VRTALSSLGFEEVIQKSHSTTATGSDFLTIRSPANTSPQILDLLKAKLPQAGFTVVGQDTVGSVVGKELAQTSLLAFGWRCWASSFT